MTNCKNRDDTVAALEGADLSFSLASENPGDETHRHDAIPASTSSTASQPMEVAVEISQVEKKSPDKHEAPVILDRLPAVVQRDEDRQQSTPPKQLDDLPGTGRQQGASRVDTEMRPKQEEVGPTDRLPVAATATDGNPGMIKVQQGGTSPGPSGLMFGGVDGSSTPRSASKRYACSECGRKFGKEQALRAHKVVLTS